MEAFIGFSESPAKDVSFEQSHSFKLVPWISWDEWDFVRVNLFSNSSQSIASALQRIATWRSRGCLPVLIEVTASIIEIQQKDPFFFRDDLTERAVESEEMLAMLYCMAITRLVNGVIEKTRKKTGVSIAEAAGAIGIPRMLIDIRHEGSHRELPSLQLVRLASMKALDWLRSYYWEPQKNAIPNQGELTINLRKEIKHRFQDLAFCLKAKQTSRSGSSLIREKRGGHLEHLCGPNKFISFMAVKHAYSKSSGSKKQVTKALKNVLRLYSSSSAEVVAVLLELLLKSFESPEFVELLKNPQNSEIDDITSTVLDDWKPVILKLLRKEPELLWSLLKAVLEKIMDQEARNDEIAESAQTEVLPCLFEWFVRILDSKKPAQVKDSVCETEHNSTEKNFPKATILELLRKCLVVSSHGNKQLMTSAIVLSRLLGNKPLNQKLEKLLSLNILGLDVSEAFPFESNPENFLSREKESLHLAAKSLELIKLGRTKSNIMEPTDNRIEEKTRWAVAKSWNPCPIGMLPHTLGYSGSLPILDCNTEIPNSSNSRNMWQLNQCFGKSEAHCTTEPLDNVKVKTIREGIEACEIYDNERTTDDIRGHLMIDGVWKKVREEELIAIASDIRILV